MSARKGGFDIGPDRLVVRTLRCGRSNPGSNPGLDRILFCTGDETAIHDGTTEQLVATLTTKNLSNIMSARKGGFDIGPDRLVVRTPRCGSSNPGSNPSLDRISFCSVDENSHS